MSSDDGEVSELEFDAQEVYEERGTPPSSPLMPDSPGHLYYGETYSDRERERAELEEEEEAEYRQTEERKKQERIAEMQRTRTEMRLGPPITQEQTFV